MDINETFISNVFNTFTLITLYQIVGLMGREAKPGVGDH